MFENLDDERVQSVFGGDDRSACLVLESSDFSKLDDDNKFRLHLVSYLFARQRSYTISAKYLCKRFGVTNNELFTKIPLPLLKGFIDTYQITIEKYPRGLLIFEKVVNIIKYFDPQNGLIIAQDLFMKRPEYSFLFHSVILAYIQIMNVDVSNPSNSLFRSLKDFLIGVPEKEKLRLIINQCVKSFPLLMLEEFLQYTYKHISSEPILRYILLSDYCPVLSLDQMITVFSFFITQTGFHSSLFISFTNYCYRIYGIEYESESIEIDSIRSLINSINNPLPDFSRKIFNVVKSKIGNVLVTPITFEVFFDSYSNEDIKQLSIQIINGQVIIPYLRVILKNCINKQSSFLSLLSSIMICGLFVVFNISEWNFEFMTQAIMNIKIPFFMNQVLAKILDLCPHKFNVSMELLSHLSFTKEAKVLFQLLDWSINKNIHALDDEIYTNPITTAKQIIRIFTSNIYASELFRKEIVIGLTSVSARISKDALIASDDIPVAIRNELNNCDLVGILTKFSDFAPLKLESITISTIASELNKVELDTPSMYICGTLGQFLESFIDNNGRVPTLDWINDEYAFINKEIDRIYSKETASSGSYSVYGFVKKLNPFSK